MWCLVAFCWYLFFLPASQCGTGTSRWGGPPSRACTWPERSSAPGGPPRRPGGQRWACSRWGSCSQHRSSLKKNDCVKQFFFAQKKLNTPIVCQDKDNVWQPVVASFLLTDKKQWIFFTPKLNIDKVLNCSSNSNCLKLRSKMPHKKVQTYCSKTLSTLLRCPPPQRGLLLRWGGGGGGCSLHPCSRPLTGTRSIELCEPWMLIYTVLS